MALTLKPNVGRLRGIRGFTPCESGDRVRTLMIMRHGKSKWPDDGRPDSERPLARRGKREAIAVARALQEKGTLPQIVATSPARRARATARRLVREWQTDVAIIVLPDLYGEGLAGCLRAIRSLPDDASCALVVGHNPAFEELILQLTRARVTLKTAMLACVDLPVAVWAAVGATTDGTLRCVYGPRGPRFIA